jgi:hypothetical protein
MHKAVHAAKHKGEECLEEEAECGLCHDRMLRRLLEGHMVEPSVQARHLNLMARSLADLTSKYTNLQAEHAELKKRKVGGCVILLTVCA